MATQRELEQWLQEGIIAAKAGQLEQARFRLLDVVEQDQTNEAAWFWLYQVFDRRDDKRLCLENLIIINPQNEWAQEELLNYVSPPAAQAARRQPIVGDKPAHSKSIPSEQARSSPASRPIALKLVVAFWLGISVMFTVGGIIAAGEWLISSARTRTFPYYLTGFQVVDLLVAVIFVMAGVMGVYVAILLFSRSMAGFYGSVILALGLLLVGPFISLIVDPPNYPAMICTGGISGMIVLLTLASQPGFADS